jgi:hypothetical protein
MFIEFYSNYLALLLTELTYQAECLNMQVYFIADNEFVIRIFGFSHAVEKLVEEMAPLVKKSHRRAEGAKLFKLAYENMAE